MQSTTSIKAIQSDASQAVVSPARKERGHSPTWRKRVENVRIKGRVALRIRGAHMDLVRPPILPEPTNPWAHQLPAQCLLAM